MIKKLILIMMIKIVLKIMIKNNKLIKLMEIINNSNRNHNNNINREKTKINNFFYIQTTKRLSCQICSINITFIMTKMDICV